jgi:GNAT superfamily N-acetyltransferase
MKRRIEIYSLEMTSSADLRPSRPRAEGFRVERAWIPTPELNRFLYTAVGGDWYWIDRLEWTYRQWLAWLDRPELETWIGFLEGTPAGYFELERQSAGTVEVAYFGLLPGFLGRGLGGALLTAAIERAWGMGASRVWVHTCSLDGPAAFANYQARGFRLYATETVEKEFPAEPPGPWPGAGERRPPAATC